MIWAAFGFGLLIGSFLYAIVWRIHTNRSIVKGRSVCESCGHQLAAIDLIPVLSWLWLRGKCRYCQARVSWSYPAVELLTGGIFALLYAWASPDTAVEWWRLAFWLVIASALIILSLYDLHWMLLPDVVLLPTLGLALVAVLASIVSGHGGWDHILSGLIAGGAFYALAAISGGRWMGGVACLL